MGLSQVRMVDGLEGLEVIHRERLQRLQRLAQERYMDLIDRSTLSPRLKTAIHARYDAAFPVIHLNPEFSFNASYAQNSQTGAESFDLNLSTLGLPDETILDIMAHESGHFFSYSLDFPDLQAAMTRGDIQNLTRLRGCADRSTVLGEFAVEVREGIERPDPDRYRERIAAKREEALGDLFIRGERLVRPFSNARAAPPGESLFCDQTHAGVNAIYRELAPPGVESTNSGAEVPDASVYEAHARSGWRIPWLTQSRESDLGESNALPRGPRCESILWNRPGREE
jgi:hypothetical protein